MNDVETSKSLKAIFLGFDHPSNKVAVIDCAVRHVDKDTRVFYSVHDEFDASKQNGFDAVVVEMVGGATMDSVASWKHEESTFEIVGYAQAAFDGVRHLYLGENGDGYVHYPNFPRLMATLVVLSQLVGEYCSKRDDSDLIQPAAVLTDRVE